MRVAYALDTLLSIPRARATMGATWAEFVATEGSSKALLDVRGLRHPCLAGGDAVENDWCLGESNALLTGPNAGGKSTLLKATLAAVLMAQTLTIAPCSGGCRLTPFSYLSSHINVPDSAGRESLFEAEMHRAKRNLDTLSALAPGRRALIVMDEIFSSTNPVEGIAGAFAVARRLAAHPGALCIISTHYTYLCKLERETGGLFLNFRMPVGDTDKFKLMRGVSRQYVALELLRRSGFDEGIVSDAIEVKRTLLSAPPRKSKTTANEAKANEAKANEAKANEAKANEAKASLGVTDDTDAHDQGDEITSEVCLGGGDGTAVNDDAGDTGVIGA
jgi:DNA mismatch repair ATPase MutS